MQTIRKDKDCFLNTSDYDFKPFNGPKTGRKIGLSGMMYIATPKKAKTSSLPTVLVKHELYTSACNEFMASRVGEYFGINIPSAYLFRVDEEDRHLFKSPYVVGIQYFENLKPVDLSLVLDSYGGFCELVGCYALNMILEQYDGIETLMEVNPNGSLRYVLTYDFTEGFNLSEQAVRMLYAMNSTFAESFARNAGGTVTAFRDVGENFINGSVAGFCEFDFSHAVNMLTEILISHMKKNGLEPAAEYTGSFGQTDRIPDRKWITDCICGWFEDIEFMSDTTIAKLTAPLGKIYPATIRDFYEKCLMFLRANIAEELPLVAGYHTEAEVKAALTAQGYFDTEQAFYDEVREKFGSRGVRDAKKEMERTIVSFRRADFPLDSCSAVMKALQHAYLMNKEEAREKYTPKKYRKEATVD